MKKADLLVIGCGNEWASDDAVGLQVIRSLKRLREEQLGVREEKQWQEAGPPGVGPPGGTSAGGLDDGKGVLPGELPEAKKFRLSDGVELIEAGTPGLNLLDLWDGADRVIIVDAVKSGAAPGTVHSFDASLLPPRDVMPVSSHGVNIIDAVELGRLLGRLPAELTVIGVEIRSEEPWHVGLTPEVAAAVPRACQRVLEMIGQILRG
jgi:hydrogenase maturation protease